MMFGIADNVDKTLSRKFNNTNYDINGYMHLALSGTLRFEGASGLCNDMKQSYVVDEKRRKRKITGIMLYQTLMKGRVRCPYTL